MTDQQPIEPSAIVDRKGANIPYRRAASGAVPRLPGELRALARTVTAGPVITASAIALTAAAAAKAFKMAGQMAWPIGPRARKSASTGSWTAPGYVEVTWTSVQIRWRS